MLFLSNSPLTKSVKNFNYHYIPQGFFPINSAIHQHKWTLNTPSNIFTKSNKVLIQNAVLWKRLTICTCNNNKCSQEYSKSNSEPHKLQTNQWQLYKLHFTILHTFNTITIRMLVHSHSYLSYKRIHNDLLSGALLTTWQLPLLTRLCRQWKQGATANQISSQLHKNTTLHS